jgi:DNA invertase Pin-like site-specific DNA recombinase
MLIGYARVSTQDQNLDLQHSALTGAGCDKIYEDKISGTRAERPGLGKALEMLRDGDTLVVWKLDRLGRSVKHLVDLVGALAARGVNFKSLTDSIDTRTPSGRFFFHVMASLAEMERELMVERTQAGLEAARRMGRTGGRRRQMTDSKISAAKRLLADGVAPRNVAKNLGVSIPTLYRWVPARNALSDETEFRTDVPDSGVSLEMRALGKPATDAERERSRELILNAANRFGFPVHRASAMESHRNEEGGIS